MSIPYRREIDGLRAIAILPVILFHIGVVGFGGGFIGVDIFFVISGFLITSIIIHDIENGTFSFSHFFERRIRRIIPALVIVLFTTMVVGYFLLLYPDDLSELGKSLFSQSLFLSNVFFLRNENYFATPSETLPLLHTWTVSVEEQFYILFPAVLFFILVYLKKKALPTVLTIGFLSFIISVYWVNVAPGSDFNISFLPDILWNGATNQSAGFYLLPSRAWELMAGAVIAIWSLRIESRKVAEVFSFVGLIAIIYAVTQFDLYTQFPGIAALVPVFGSVAIIISNTHTKTFVGKLLSLPLFVWVGLISYSLYLWHWPVLVFAKTMFPELNLIQKVALILISTGLAWATYRLIERPFKQKKYFPNRKPLIIAGVTALGAMFLLGYGTLSTNFDYRIPEYTKPLFEAEKNMGHRYTECLKTKTATKIVEEGPCLLGQSANNINPSFVLLGDSHAGTIVSTLDNVSVDQGVKGAAFLAPGCLPIVGAYRPDKSETCTQVLDLAMNYIQTNNIKNVLLVSNWNHYTGGTPGVFIMDADSKEESAEESRRVFEKRMIEMVKGFEDSGIDVFLMKEIPVQNNYDQRNIFRTSVQNGHLIEVGEISYAEHQNYNSYVNEVFSKMTTDYGVSIIDPAEVLCNTDQTCALYSGDTIIYSNNDHLNFVGANMLTGLFQDLLLPFQL